MANRILMSGSEKSYFGRSNDLGKIPDDEILNHFNKYKSEYFKDKPDFDDGDTTYKYAIIRIHDDEKGKYEKFPNPGFYKLI